MEWECTGDRQEYHTDGTLHIIRNVQGTDIIIYIYEISQVAITNTHTDGQSQIVAYWAATFAAKNLYNFQHLLKTPGKLKEGFLITFFKWLSFSLMDIGVMSKCFNKYILAISSEYWINSKIYSCLC